MLQKNHVHIFEKLIKLFWTVSQINSYHSSLNENSLQPNKQNEMDDNNLKNEIIIAELLAKSRQIKQATQIERKAKITAKKGK